MSKFSFPNKLKLSDQELFLNFPFERIQAIERMFEFVFLDVVEKKSKVVFAFGNPESPFFAVALKFIQKLGLEAVFFIEAKPPLPGAFEKSEGRDPESIMRLRMMGYRIIYADLHEEAKQRVSNESEYYRKRDMIRPYFLPSNLCNEWGALTYAEYFSELKTNDDRFEELVMVSHAYSQADTIHAGYLLYLSLNSTLADQELPSCHYFLGPSKVVSEALGVIEEKVLFDRIKSMMIAAIQRFKMPISMMPSDIVLIDKAEWFFPKMTDYYDFLVSRSVKTKSSVVDSPFMRILFGISETGEPNKAKVLDRLSLQKDEKLPFDLGHLARALVRAGL